MLLSENNGNGVTIPKWLLTMLLSIVIATAAWATGVSFQAKSALPRIEAAEIYVSRQDHDRDMVYIQRQLDRIVEMQDRASDKLDRLLAR